MIEDVIYICILRRRQQQRTELITNIYQDIKREMSYLVHSILVTYRTSPLSSCPPPEPKK